MEYEDIAERALTTPPNTAALMDLIKFMNVTIAVTLEKLENQLIDSINHILFLSDYWLLTESEISNNNVAFQWYHKMPEILEKNQALIQTKMVEYQHMLKGRDLPRSRSLN